MSDLSNENRRQLRRMRFQQGYHRLVAQGVFSGQPVCAGPSAELWVCVAFALLANFVSRVFGWLRVFAYVAFLLAVILCVQEDFDFNVRHVVLDLISVPYLIYSAGRLLIRECTS